MELKKVDLTIRWVELFGNKKADIHSDVKKERWNQWLKLASEQNEYRLLAYWTKTPETCVYCKNNNSNWCTYSDLPCTVNPILTFNHAIKGLACQGVGFINKSV